MSSIVYLARKYQIANFVIGENNYALAA